MRASVVYRQCRSCRKTPRLLLLFGVLGTSLVFFVYSLVFTANYALPPPPVPHVSMRDESTDPLVTAEELLSLRQQQLHMANTPRSAEQLLDDRARNANDHERQRQPTTAVSVSDASSTYPTVCVHSVESPRRIVDSMGSVCTAADPNNGCCPVNERMGATCAHGQCAQYPSPARWCCAHYEHCVSCCMAERRASLPAMHVRDSFAPCRIACRTSSDSVYSELVHHDMRGYLRDDHFCFSPERMRIMRRLFADYPAWAVPPHTQDKLYTDTAAAAANEKEKDAAPVLRLERF